MKESSPTIILILGMHRSGTSLVAQIISKYGIYMGDELMESNEYNPTGYWEYTPLVKLNDKILDYLNAKWYSPPQIINVPDLIKEFGHEAKRLVTIMDKQNITWCWKDPRFIILFDFWKDIFKDRDVIYILPFRNPAAVVESIIRRDNLPDSFIASFWEYNILKLAKHYDELYKNLLVDYDKLIANPKIECQKIFDFLNTKLNHNKSNDILESIIKCVIPNLNSPISDSGFQLSVNQYIAYQALTASDLSRITEVDLRLNYILTGLSFININNDLDYIKGYAQLFYSNSYNDFNEDNSIKEFVNNLTSKLEFSLPPADIIERLRFDPLNKACIIKFKSATINTENGEKFELSVSSSNATINHNNIFYFETNDPNIYFESNYKHHNKNNVLKIEIQYLAIGSNIVNSNTSGLKNKWRLFIKLFKG